jgi:hypothetical protein
MLEYALALFMNFRIVEAMHNMEAVQSSPLVRQIIAHPDWVLISLRSIAWSLHHEQPDVVYTRCLTTLSGKTKTYRVRTCKRLKMRAKLDLCVFVVGPGACGNSLVPRKEGR